MSFSDSFTEINAIAARVSKHADPEAVESLRARAVATGMSLDTFRASALALMPHVSPVREYKPLDIPPNEWDQYSISKAIMSQLPGSNVDAGREREFSQEIKRQHRGVANQGLLIPNEVMTRNYIFGGLGSSGTLGGNLVQTTNLGSQFIDLLRNKCQVLNLGATVLNLDTPVTIPRQNAAMQVNWVGETVASTLSSGNFNQVTLQPNAITAYGQYSKELLSISAPSVDMLLRNDIVAQLAIAIDLAALAGTGSGQPLGLINTTGIGSVLLATNGLALNNATAYPAMVSLESTVAAANADVGALAYLCRPAVRAQLKTQTRFANTNTPVWEDGQVNGIRAEVTNQISNSLTTGTATTITTPVYFGNWSDLIIANFAGGATDLVVDPFSLAANGVVRIIARRFCDVGVRHPASFAVLGGVLNG